MKNMVLAAHNFDSDRGHLPPGVGDYPILSNLPDDRPSVQALILPYIEQAAKYSKFDFRYDVNTDAINAPARVQDVEIYLCPSDYSEKRVSNDGGKNGRSNYMASMGATANARTDDRAVVGIFNWKAAAASPYRIITKCRFDDITDGSAGTAMFGETKRGTLSNLDPGYNSTSMMIIGTLPSFTDRAACTACNSPAGTVIRYGGLQYYRDLPATYMYTHTMTPNQGGGESLTFNQWDCGGGDYYTAHKAARSYHTGGVNIGFCDGSVRFFRDTIKLPIWKALGTRSGNEIVDEGS